MNAPSTWLPYWAVVFKARYCALHKRWIVIDPDDVSLIFSSGRSQEEAESAARQKFERRRT